MDYAAKKSNSNSSKLLFRTNINIKNTGTVYAEQPQYESNYLRSSGAEYVPVTIVNGYGEVTLTSYPERNTYLDIYAAKCSDIYTVTYDYIEGLELVNRDTSFAVSVIKNGKTKDALNGISQIVISDTSYDVSEIQEDDNYYYIVIPTAEMAVDPDKNILTLNNVLRIGR